MKWSLPILALPLCLAGCATPQFDPTDVSAGEFAPLVLPAAPFDDVDQVIAFYLKDTGRSAPTTRAVKRDAKDDAEVVLLFSAEGYQDDSVAGEQWRVALHRSGAGYNVTRAGVRYRCYRADQTEWRKALCP